MKNFILIALLCAGIYRVQGQVMPLTAAPDGGNKKASVSEQIGIVKININYSRPGVKGREGKIWNTPVAHYGFVDLGHGTSTAAPWRAGANENTTISFSQRVKIEGKDLPAGTYGFSIALGEAESTLIFSNVSTSWGSFYYDPAFDALRVTVKNKSQDKSVEWLKYEFTDQTDSSAVIALSWEKRTIPFRVDADVKKLQMASFRREFMTTRQYEDFIQAAEYCIQHNYELDQALAWMDRAISFRIMGQRNYRTLSTKAAVLMKMNRVEDAKKVMEEALPMGSMVEVYIYGRTLIEMGQKEEGMKVHKLNYDRHPNEFFTNVGMGRAWSAMGDYKKALTFMQAALPMAPSTMNKTRVEGMIKTLKEGKDVN
jgi:tetratricopeptide (TPR) repeat protein